MRHLVLKRFLCSLVAVGALASPLSAFAAQTSWTSGTVSYLSCFGNNYCSVALTGGTTSSTGTCAGGGTINTFNFSSDSLAGQAQLKVLTAAKAAGWTVSLYGYISASGYGSCAISQFQSGQEDLYQVQVH